MSDCECISKVNAELKPRNTRLALSIVATGGAYPTIQTEQIEKGRGKPKALVAVPSYCPFCGKPARQIGE